MLGFSISSPKKKYALGPTCGAPFFPPNFPHKVSVSSFTGLGRFIGLRIVLFATFALGEGVFN